MIVARLRLAPAGETGGFPGEPPSPMSLATQRAPGAAPAMSVAAANPSPRVGRMSP
jgi:hypothetical protein